MGAEQNKPSMEEVLLRKDPTSPSAPETNREAGAGGFSWLTLLGILFLTFNSAIAVYRSNGDRAAISFVVFSYLDLVLLFICLRWYERTPPGSPRREDIKMAVWLLVNMLLYSVFMLLVFWFADTGANGAKIGTAPPLQHQYPPSVPAPPWP